MRVPDHKLAEVFDRGYTVVEGFVDGADLAAAREALWQLYPRPEAYFADPAAHPRFGKTQFSGQEYFPFLQPALNRLVTYPGLIDAAERFLQTEEIDLYKVELWAKYAGAIDYDQPHHRDFGNHTLLVPTADHPHMTTFILLSDVTATTGPTKVVPMEHSRDVPLWPMLQPPGALEDVEESVEAPAGSLFIYKTDVLHRGTNLTGPEASRFVLLVDFKRRGQSWTGKQAWPDHALKPGWPEAMAAMSVRERDLFGWPAPGHPYWTPETLAGVQARYPGMDMTAYSEGMCRLGQTA